jgi:hypothetical protein
LLLPEGQTGAAWEHSKRKALSEIGERWIENYFHIFFRLSGWRDNKQTNKPTNNEQH